VPIAPNWKLEPSGTGLKLRFECGSGPGDQNRHCEFEIVESIEEQSPGTVAGTDVVCPFPDCGRVISLDEVKRQGRERSLSEILTTVVIKRRIDINDKGGRKRPTWERAYRAPTKIDDVSQQVKARLSEKMPEWEALNICPSELLPTDTESWTHGNTPHQYGAARFIDLFSSRQLLVHCTSVEVFQEILADHGPIESLPDLKRAAFVYLALSIDKLVDWNSLQCTWDLDKLRMAHTFQVHAFPIRWSFAEMDVLAQGLGYQWVIRQTSRCLKELIDLTNPEGATLFASDCRAPNPVTVSLKSGDSLEHIANASIDAVIMDPPYGANVMYAELADFFYVWLKRTAGLVVPELFTRQLTAKETEAVSNKAKFPGVKGSNLLAIRDYRERMQSIFAECKRVLKADGIMTVMFTHKDTGAWDALTKGLIDAGFIITASWPVNTEAESSTHIKNKAAANSTIFLVCRPRPANLGRETMYWEDIEPLVAEAVRIRVEEFQAAGITGVDLYLASFGPALEEFSRHWPVKRGTPRPEPLAKRRRKQAELFEEEFDPYAVTPEDALDAARREVKTWRLNQLTHTKGRGDLDATTSWFVLAWDAFKAPVFSYDEGLRLARAVGADLDGQLIGKICEKKGSDVKLWDSVTRAAKNALGPADGSRAMIDAIHHAAYRGRTRTLDAALDLIKDSDIENDPQFLAALEAVLEVLPPSRSFVGFDVASGDAKSAADDFDALEKLRRLAFSDRVGEPQQLSLFVEDAA
jgi:adenine-specific DNA methylase